MNRMDWDDIRFFLAAARAGSLAGASRQLGSHQPTVGRRIDALESAWVSACSSATRRG